MKQGPILGCILALGCGGSSGPPEPLVATDNSFPAEPDPGEPVEVDLIADTREVAPGSAIEVAVRFTVEPGWKIYWTNPGQAGLPTLASLSTPDGFDVGEPVYPAPHPFVGPRGSTSYGYSGEVLVVSEVTAPESLPDGELAFTAEASWLACQDVCKRGRATANMELPSVPSAAALTPVNRDLFARHQSRVPEPLDREACTIDFEPDASTAVIDCAGASTLELYPDRSTQKKMVGQISSPTQAGAKLRLRFEKGALPDKLGGVLRAETAGRATYYDLSG